MTLKGHTLKGSEELFRTRLNYRKNYTQQDKTI